jgi:hypothetical protein
MSLSHRPESFWINLVRDIYKNRESCPHRQSLKKILKDASKVYCAVAPERIAEGDEDIRLSEDSGKGFTGSESGWLHLVKNILRNSNCKYHGKLKLVLKRASRLYCKPKKSRGKSSKSPRRTSRRRTSKSSRIMSRATPAPTPAPTILQSLGLA